MKYIVSFVLSLLICFLSLALILASVLSVGIFSKNTYSEIVNRFDISQKVYSEIENVFLDQSGGSNIPPEVYEDIITLEDVERIFPDVVDSVMSYAFGETDEIKPIEIDFTALEKSLTDYFVSYAKEHNIAMDDAFDNQLKLTIKSAKESVTSSIDLAVLKKGADLIRPRIKTIKTAVGISLGVVAAAFVLLSLLLILTAKKHGVFWILSSVLSSSAISLAVVSLLRIFGFFDGFILKNEVLHTFITGFLKVLSDSIIITSAVILTFSVLGMVYFVFKIKRERCLQE